MKNPIRNLDPSSAFSQVSTTERNIFPSSVDNRYQNHLRTTKRPNSLSGTHHSKIPWPILLYYLTHFHPGLRFDIHPLSFLRFRSPVCVNDKPSLVVQKFHLHFIPGPPPLSLNPQPSTPTRPAHPTFSHPSILCPASTNLATRHPPAPSPLNTS